MHLVQRQARLNPRPTNLIQRSSSFSGSTWVNSSTSMSEDGTLDPINGLAEVTLITTTSAGTNRFITCQLPAAGNEDGLKGGYQIPVCWSVYMKAASATALAYINALDNSSSALAFYFNPNTGATGSVSSSNGTLTRISFGVFTLANGWYRLWISGYGSASVVLPLRMRIGNCTADASTTSALNENVYAYGAQVEPYAWTPGPLIPTTAFGRRVRF